MRIPSHPNRRYLSGLDWIVYGLDWELRHGMGTGLLSQVVLELDGPLDTEAFVRAMTQFAGQFLCLRGKLARDATLAPYWRLPRANGPIAIPFVLRTAETQEAAFLLLTEAVNKPLPPQAPYLAFQVVRVPGHGDMLAMAFDHRMFDARGAELFLKLFCDWIENPVSIEPAIESSIHEPARLDLWREKFEAGRLLRQALLEIRQKPLVRPPPPGRRAPVAYDYQLLRLNKPDSEAVVENANRVAGPLLLMPYLLAGAIRAFAPLLGADSKTGEGVLVPVTLDMRARNEANRRVFFNHASFLLLSAAAEDLPHAERLTQRLRDECYRQIKDGFPGHVREASLLMRILPLCLARLFLNYPTGQVPLSFCFGYLGDSAAQDFVFQGTHVAGIFHTPRVPRPYAGCFFSQAGGKLTATIAAAKGMFTSEQMRSMPHHLRQMLLPHG